MKDKYKYKKMTKAQQKLLKLKLNNESSIKKTKNEY